MKALSVQEAQKYTETHSLLELADTCAPYDPIFIDSNAREFLRRIDAFDQVGRYGAAAKHDPLRTSTEEFETKGVMVWLQAYRGLLDEFVFRVREKLDYLKIGYDDSLRSILSGNASSMLMGTWTGEQDLRDVLVRENDFFK